MPVLLGLLLGWIVLASVGCAGLTSTIPPPSFGDPGRLPDHYVLDHAPALATHWDLGIAVYLRWTHPYGSFTSVSLQPFGTASDETERRPCLQVYWGIKVDGTESSTLGAPPFDYVFTPTEQSAFRWLGNQGCGIPRWWDMGGS